jgi:hypothetical protein
MEAKVPRSAGLFALGSLPYISFNDVVASRLCFLAVRQSFRDPKHLVTQEIAYAIAN